MYVSVSVGVCARVQVLQGATFVVLMLTTDAVAKRKKRKAPTTPKPEMLPDFNEVLTTLGRTPRTGRTVACSRGHFGR